MSLFGDELCGFRCREASAGVTAGQVGMPRYETGK